MRRSIIIAVLAMLPFLFGSASRPSQHNDESLVLKITSENPKEIITFDGCYFLGGDESTFQTVKLQTPFQIERKTDEVVAVVHKVSGKGNLKIELLTRKGDELSSNLAGTGNVMALTTDKLSKPYIHTIQIVD